MAIHDPASGTDTAPCPGCGKPLGERYHSIERGEYLCWPCYQQENEYERLADAADGFHQRDKGTYGEAGVPANPTTKLSAVQKRRLRWAWRGWLALGYLAVWCGEGEIGKSTFAAYVIRQLAAGRLPGEFINQPQPSLIVCEEDGRGDMWSPKLEAGGVNPELLHFLDYPDGWDLRSGIQWLRNGVRGSGAKLIYVDSLMSHLPDAHGGENTRSPSFVRRALAPLARLCQEENVTALFGLHPRKAGGDTFADVVQESGAFTQLPRIGLLFGYHPDDDELPKEQRRRVVLRGKGNVGRSPGALSFRIASKVIEFDDSAPDGEVEEFGYITDVQACEVTERDLLRRVKPQEREPSKVETAEALIEAGLADGHYHWAEPMWEELRRLDVAATGTVTTAKRNLGVESRQKEGSAHAGWYWRIPNSSISDPKWKSDPPRARRISEGNLTSENGPNPNTDGQILTFPVFERTEDAEGSDSQMSNASRARARHDDWTEERAEELLGRYMSGAGTAVPMTKENP